MKPTLQGQNPFSWFVNGEVRWTTEGGYVGRTGGGKTFGIYGNESPSPMEMVLHGHAACSLIDVIDGLKDRVSNVEYATVEVEAVRADEAPRVFTSVHFRYVVKGDVPELLVHRIIESSHEKYCSVGIMITRSGTTLDWELEII